MLLAKCRNVGLELGGVRRPDVGIKMFVEDEPTATVFTRRVHKENLEERDNRLVVDALATNGDVLDIAIFTMRLEGDCCRTIGIRP